jgi:hypothetical protein
VKGLKPCDTVLIVCPRPKGRGNLPLHLHAEFSGQGMIEIARWVWKDNLEGSFGLLLHCFSELTELEGERIFVFVL